MAKIPDFSGDLGRKAGLVSGFLRHLRKTNRAVQAMFISSALKRGAVVAILAVASGAAAENPPPFPDFTFKRVKPPSSEGAKRITVQIAPQVTPVVPATESDAAPKAAAQPVPALDWFWAEISPALSDGGQGRLEPALVRLGNPPAGTGVPVPRLSTFLGIARDRNADLLLSTVGTNVSPALALAVIAVEFDALPAAPGRFGEADAEDAGQNIREGVAYLHGLLEEFQGDPILALAAYYAGEDAVRQHEGVPPDPETRAFVPKVLAAFAAARGLCKTPPQLVSDGCVFNLGD